MRNAFEHCSLISRQGGIVRLFSFALLLALGPFAIGAQADPGCNRAREMVAQVRTATSTPAEHRGRLTLLETARDLCPSLGEAWHLSSCSEAVLGNSARAEIYRKRAVLSGWPETNCAAQDSSLALGSADDLGPVRRKFALVVGIGRFLDPAIESLRYTAKDARDFADFLVQEANFSGDSVKLLTDEQATRSGILRELNQLMLRSRADDLVVLYMSSHGSPYQESQGLGGVGYFVTHDTLLKDLWDKGLEFRDLAEKVSQIPARRVVTFLDSCFSGQAALAPGAKQLVLEGSGLDVRTAESFLSGEGTYVVTSSAANQVSWESDELENSYFTYYLMESLRGTEPPTLATAFSRLADRVQQAVATDKDAIQRPVLQPRDAPGDLKLGVIPQNNNP